MTRASWFLALCAVAVLLLAALFTMGALSGQFTADTVPYFVAATSAQPWGEIRHPAYGFVAMLLGASQSQPGYVALAQALLHVVASLALYCGARCGGIGRAGAFALALVALLSQSGIYQLRLLMPESFANSCLLLTFACALAASGAPRGFWGLLVPAALLTGAAYLLRPSLLPAIFVVPVAYALLAWRNGQRGVMLRACALVLAAALPFLAQSGIRQRAVGDFNVTSFGGYQMSALAAFMLTPEIVARLPEGARDTAQAMLTAREKAETAGLVARTPLNSTGERSFVSAALGYFDIYARSYDDVLTQVTMTLRGSDESWVAFNRRLTQFDIATVRAAPGRWLAWIGGASARLAGHAIVTNATMLVALGLLAIAALPALVRRRAPGENDLGAVCLVALGWFACTAPLAVLVTFPAARYIDSAAMLLPAIPLALAIALMCKLSPGAAA